MQNEGSNKSMESEDETPGSKQILGGKTKSDKSPDKEMKEDALLEDRPQCQYCFGPIMESK